MPCNHFLRFIGYYFELCDDLMLGFGWTGLGFRRCVSCLDRWTLFVGFGCLVLVLLVGLLLVDSDCFLWLLCFRVLVTMLRGSIGCCAVLLVPLYGVLEFLLSDLFFMLLLWFIDLGDCAWFVWGDLLWFVGLCSFLFWVLASLLWVWIVGFALLLRRVFCGLI